MMALNKVMLWVVTVLAVAFLFFPSYVGVLFGTGDDAAVTENMNRAVFQIEGMTCEGCATTVAQAIRQVPGVVAVDVSYEKKQAVVGVKSGERIPEQEILSALKNAGYSGKVLTRESFHQVGNKTEIKSAYSQMPRFYNLVFSTTSPPARVLKARQMLKSTFSMIERVEPSKKTTLTMPVW